MNTKPNSIQLAEALEAQVQVGGGDLHELELAAAELRNLERENNLLVSLCDKLRVQHREELKPLLDVRLQRDQLISAVKDFLHADHEWNSQPDTWSFSTEKVFRRLVELRNQLQATVDQLLRGKL
jgi:hypothetical protein